jgi:carboxypeptidase-like protein
MSSSRILWASLLLGLWLGPDPAAAQRIFGTVRDSETDRPLPGAHVFIAGSLLGTATGPGGEFRLDRVPAGSHRVVASMVGFARMAVDTTIGTGEVEINFSLPSRVIEAGAVEVIAHSDPKWAKRLKKFRAQFVGESEAAAYCVILNPEVLDFETRWWGRLAATASAPLIIENRWLGYRVTYHLTDFRHTAALVRYDGDPVFEELEPVNEEEQVRWQLNRIKAFNGSLRHFLLALVADSTREHGFHTYRRPSLEDPNRSAARFPVSAERLTGRSDSVGTVLRFSGYVEIIYDRELEDPAIMRAQGSHRYRRPAAQRSWIKLSDGPTKIDRLGSVVDPYGVTISGYLAFERVADELPKEYRPPGIFLIPGT